MSISGDFFERILLDKSTFRDEIEKDFYDRASQDMGVHPHFNRSRIYDAYFQWKQDLERICLVEENVTNPDHLKCAAHLIYWLRRSSPVDEFAYDHPRSEAKEFMLRYGREYLAFDLGYRAAHLYECEVHGRDLPLESFSLTSTLPGIGHNDFIETVAHVLKTKNVSPHALFLVLKAVFLRA